MTETHEKDSFLCTCRGCVEEVDVDIPDAILDACLQRKLVVFAGAGVSTENWRVLPETLFQVVCDEHGLDSETTTFHEAMSALEEASGRSALLSRIKSRFDYVDVYDELRVQSTRFHRELSTLFPVTEVITTNWDDYFETEIGATPFVNENDWAYWDIAERRVFKLHGSITNPGSVVATSADYEECESELRSGVLGATIQTLLATKTIVFIGYSLNDPDFASLFSTLKERMGKLMPPAYWVGPDANEPPTPFDSLRILRTDGTHFLKLLKKALPRSEFIPDERFKFLHVLDDIVHQAHEALYDQCNIEETPEVLLCGSFQDGLIHGVDVLLNRRRSGKPSHVCAVERWVRTYEDFYSKFESAGDKFNSAYVLGFLEALYFFLDDDEDTRWKDLDVFYVSGNEERLKKIEDFKRVAKNAEALDAETHARLVDQVKVMDDAIVLHHRPALYGLYQLMDPDEQRQLRQPLV